MTLKQMAGVGLLAFGVIAVSRCAGVTPTPVRDLSYVSRTTGVSFPAASRLTAAKHYKGLNQWLKWRVEMPASELSAFLAQPSLHGDDIDKDDFLKGKAFSKDEEAEIMSATKYTGLWFNDGSLGLYLFIIKDHPNTAVVYGFWSLG